MHLVTIGMCIYICIGVCVCVCVCVHTCVCVCVCVRARVHTKHGSVMYGVQHIEQCISITMSLNHRMMQSRKSLGVHT